MNIAEIEFALKDLVETPFNSKSFIFQFLEIYDAPKATITKLKQGSTNQSKEPGDLLWKNKLFFRVATVGQAAKTVDVMMVDPLAKKNTPRFLLSTDGNEVYCRDVKADQTVDISFGKLNDIFDFFLPLAGIERYEGVAENPADIKATGRLAKLYDAILEANPDWIGHNHTHELNLLMTRLLFCFFAEDTSIFDKDLFTSSVLNLTREDGVDTALVLDTLFSAMNTHDNDRAGLPEYARRFPFVNGGLFRDKTPVPIFSKRARRLLKECGELTWREINPDIFGSMIQAVVEPGMRGDMGMHYTSVPNIMKVLQPLFLLSLEEEFEAARDSETKLKKLLNRIYNIRVFDPACGSGNFLIIAYREMRKLETRIFARQKEIAIQWALPMTGVQLTQFFGIELADFAVETAKLSLWIAEYQMNEQFKAVFGEAPPALPLRDSGHITQGNAILLNWISICPPKEGLVTYIVGNPPYLGSSMQSSEQKAEIANLFAKITKSFKNLDYVTCWYLKAADYMQVIDSECAFVATNSICQGEQVGLLWPLIFQKGIEIGFGHQSFKWKNNASNNAGVTCIIVGIRKRQKTKKWLFAGDLSHEVENIGPYLIEMDDLIVYKSSAPISKYALMLKGNQPSDGGNLILSPKERLDLLLADKNASLFLRRYYGSQEFIKGIERWCLWIEPEDQRLANSIPPIAKRIKLAMESRLSSTAPTTVARADTAYRFIQIQNYGIEAIFVPRLSSERRKYIPVGLMPADCIISDQGFAIYGAPDYLISIISSRLHAIWLASVGGRMKTDYRYSNTLVYNTFPVPVFSTDQKLLLEEHAANILGVREAYPGKTIAWLYDPESMPDKLLKAHRNLDDALESIYIGRPFKSDTERLEHLFKLYSAMIKKGQSAKAPKQQRAIAKEAA